MTHAYFTNKMKNNVLTEWWQWKWMFSRTVTVSLVSQTIMLFMIIFGTLSLWMYETFQPRCMQSIPNCSQFAGEKTRNRILINDTLLQSVMNSNKPAGVRRLHWCTESSIVVKRSQMFLDRNRLDNERVDRVDDKWTFQSFDAVPGM